MISKGHEPIHLAPMNGSIHRSLFTYRSFLVIPPSLPSTAHSFYRDNLVIGYWLLVIAVDLWLLSHVRIVDHRNMA